MATDEELLGEIEDVIRTMPDPDTFHHREGGVLDWLGRVKALFETMKGGSYVEMNLAISKLGLDHSVWQASREIMLLIRSARHKLRMQTTGPLSLVVDRGMVFEYFDALRQVIEEARKDVFFIDPYLDADVVKRYAPFVGSGVTVRMLARERVKTLVPAAQAFTAQNGTPIEVRSGSSFHDRFVIVDSGRIFQSGASFKDGGHKTPTTLTEIADAANEMRRIYEDIWSKSVVAL
ncbi:hypothetical protein PWG15_05515 [Ensifer adhaerens]|uniref:hypothetical protein n=1 Tax=Ensifer adhaerens TaxID=106592 RepID=UPI0023A92FAB|nr:hypothetical protein [Ensifer adhaerens]WDZ77963.1 hypothetical protein PWG15_05515 [Ensifer adhaerens]